MDWHDNVSLYIADNKSFRQIKGKSGFSTSSLPPSWIPTLMVDGEYYNLVVQYSIINGVRKSPKITPPNVGIFFFE